MLDYEWRAIDKIFQSVFKSERTRLATRLAKARQINVVSETLS